MVEGNKQLQRLPHAALDPRGRLPKAEKIRKLLGLDKSSGKRLRLLEVGTGSGAIAGYFASRADLDCEVDAVDVVDQRQVGDGYRFQLVESVKLPFDDGVFDVVISNHVVEHVGGAADQRLHLHEIVRVLRPGGIVYLATPNRWQVVEPHYHLAFLSWLPRRWRSGYLRISGKGAEYDCEPLSKRELEAMLDAAGIEFSNQCVPAIRAMRAIEPKPSWALRLICLLPDYLLSAMQPASPTHVYLLRAPRRGRAQ